MITPPPKPTMLPIVLATTPNKSNNKASHTVIPIPHSS
jgi:hypothetical protein